MILMGNVSGAAVGIGLTVCLSLTSIHPPNLSPYLLALQINFRDLASLVASPFQRHTCIIVLKEVTKKAVERVDCP